ncbi:chloride channel protein [Leptospira sp. WS60.C2]
MKLQKQDGRMHYFPWMVKWTLVFFLVSSIVGSFSAFFLHSLDFVTYVRESHREIFYLLPLAGFCIGWAYHHFGSKANKGNNLLLEEIHSPSSVIPFRMAPFVLVSTLITHLFGGSAGREGTAVQIGGTIAHQFGRFHHFQLKEQQTLIILGISAGFSAVFGTPIAAAIFSIEVIQVGNIRWKLFLPTLFIAWLSHKVCLLWNVKHSVFPEVSLHLEIRLILGLLLLAFVSGLVAKLFIWLLHFLTKQSQNWISYPPLRPFFGGFILLVFLLSGVRFAYFGLGVDTIERSFYETMAKDAFFWKLLLTGITIGFGFKGGEVTPLFFIGATLGNLFSFIEPIYLPIFVSVGFISVFAGATNTPVACAFMGMELFGFSNGFLFLILAQIAYITSGHTSIYSSQIVTKRIWFLPKRKVSKEKLK